MKLLVYDLLWSFYEALIIPRLYIICVHHLKAKGSNKLNKEVIYDGTPESMCIRENN